MADKACQTYDSLNVQNTPSSLGEGDVDSAMVSSLDRSVNKPEVEDPDETYRKEVESDPDMLQQGDGHGPIEMLVTQEICLHGSPREGGLIPGDCNCSEHSRRSPIPSEHAGGREYLLEFSRGRSFSGEESGYSRSWSSSISSLTWCDRCTVAIGSVKCDVTKEFWEGIEGSKRRCCERIWKNFHARLKDLFSNDPGVSNNRVMKLLKSLLEVSGELDVVHIDKFLRLVKFFGPFRSENNRCVVLEQLQELVSGSNTQDRKVKRKKICWFAGPMTRCDANSRLEGKRPGTYLIRMSESEDENGTFVASLVVSDDSIEHYRLQGHPDEAIGSQPFHMCLEFRDQKFSSLTELVNGYLRLNTISEDGDIRCSFVCEDLPYNQIINGYAE